MYTYTHLHYESAFSLTAFADRFHYVLLGGDMVTAKMVRGFQGTHGNLNRRRDHLEGLLPVVEDWHAKMWLICVSICNIVKLFHTFV